MGCSHCRPIAGDRTDGIRTDGNPTIPGWHGWYTQASATDYASPPTSPPAPPPPTAWGPQGVTAAHPATGGVTEPSQLHLSVGVRLSALQGLRALALELEPEPGPERSWRPWESPPSRRAHGEKLTTEDVCYEIVRPATQALNGGEGGAYFLLLPETEVGKATVFVSHAWSCAFKDTVEALEAAAKTLERDDAADAVFFSLDLVNCSQWDMKPRPSEWWTERLRPAIASIGTAALVLGNGGTSPVALTRARCLFEVFSAADTGADLQVFLPPGEEGTLSETLAKELEEVHAALPLINFETSTGMWPDHEESLRAAVRAGPGAARLNATVLGCLREWLLTRALAGLHLAPDDWRLSTRAASVLRDLGRLEEAEPHLRRALQGTEGQVGPNHPDTLAAVNDLAVLLRNLGRLEEAEPLQRRALQGLEGQVGPDHPDTLAAANDLAVVLRELGRLQEAEPLQRRALLGREEHLGARHVDTITSVSDLGLLLGKTRRHMDEAEPLARRALSGREELFGPDHPDTLAAVSNLALLLKARGRLEEAEPLYRRAVQGREGLLGPTHPDTLRSVNSLASLLYHRGHLEEAETLYRRAVQGREERLGPTHPDTLTSMSNLAILLQDRRCLGEAEQLFRRALEGSEARHGADHPLTRIRARNLADHIWLTQWYASLQ